MARTWNMDFLAKINAAEILDKQLANRAKKEQFGFVAVGSSTDAYMHQESTEKITQQLLQVLLKNKFPVFISTKCKLILRDIELLKAIDDTAILPTDLAQTLNRGLILSVSISTLDEKISTRLEPGTALPSERLQLLKQLKAKGFFAGVNAIPLLPFISDSAIEMEKIIIAAKEHDADYILMGGLTLFGNNVADSKTLYYKFIEQYDPSLLPKYQQLYGNNFYTSFVYQNQLKELSDRLCKKYKIRNSILA